MDQSQAAYDAGIIDLTYPTPTAGWTVVSVVDFDKDGYADLLLRNKNVLTKMSVWLLDGMGGKKGEVTWIDDLANWKVVAVDDFNGDEILDVAWRLREDYGEVRIWLLDGLGGGKGEFIYPGNAGWKVVGAGDFDGDQIPDLAWRRTTDSGEVRVWLLDGVGGRRSDIEVIESGSYKVVGAADFDGNGVADLAISWAIPPGQVGTQIFLLKSGGKVKDAFSVRPTGSDWQVIGAGDFDKDGHADLAWRRVLDTGEVRVWSIRWDLPLHGSGGSAALP